MLRLCKKCGLSKDLDCFSFDKHGPQGRTYWCKTCASKNSRDNFAIRMQDPTNRLNKREKGRNFFRDIKEKAVAYKGSKCFDCNVSYPNYVYDFHHLDSREKDMNPSKSFRLDFEQTKKELDKCVMLCSNCHRERHFGETQV